MFATTGLVGPASFTGSHGVESMTAEHPRRCIDLLAREAVRTVAAQRYPRRCSSAPART
jgi:hypothetical protein